MFLLPTPLYPFNLGPDLRRPATLHSYFSLLVTFSQRPDLLPSTEAILWVVILLYSHDHDYLFFHFLFMHILSLRKTKTIYELSTVTSPDSGTLGTENAFKILSGNKGGWNRWRDA